MAQSQCLFGTDSASYAHNLQLLAYDSFNSCAPYKPLDLSLFPLPLKWIDMEHEGRDQEVQDLELTGRRNGVQYVQSCSETRVATRDCSSEYQVKESEPTSISEQCRRTIGRKADNTSEELKRQNNLRRRQFRRIWKFRSILVYE